MAAASEPERTPDARTRVGDAKLALGERGAPWWEEPSVDDLAARDVVVATQRGEEVVADAAKGPIRIARGPQFGS